MPSQVTVQGDAKVTLYISRSYPDLKNSVIGGQKAGLYKNPCADSDNFWSKYYLKPHIAKHQEHPTTVFCKISVRRSKYIASNFLLLEDDYKFLDDRSIDVQFSKLT